MCVRNGANVCVSVCVCSGWQYHFDVTRVDCKRQWQPAGPTNLHLFIYDERCVAQHNNAERFRFPILRCAIRG